ncbi:hypothetical protein Dimus_022707 [Dionaea muscipula]
MPLPAAMSLLAGVVPEEDAARCRLLTRKVSTTSAAQLRHLTCSIAPCSPMGSAVVGYRCSLGFAAWRSIARCIMVVKLSACCWLTLLKLLANGRRSLGSLS